ncbi:hypothetical protein WMY93_031549 [Mugilogobius chulae]|uniref:Uncharacterized protein n=1 Tax=Mugilogobius chulae TaxID=88201 RepID=A0AAW0MI74_9GOBI
MSSRESAGWSCGRGRTEAGFQWLPGREKRQRHCDVGLKLSQLSRGAEVPTGQESTGPEESGRWGEAEELLSCRTMGDRSGETAARSVAPFVLKVGARELGGSVSETDAMGERSVVFSIRNELVLAVLRGCWCKLCLDRIRTIRELWSRGALMRGVPGFRLEWAVASAGGRGRRTLVPASSVYCCSCGGVLWFRSVWLASLCCLSSARGRSLWMSSVW